MTEPTLQTLDVNGLRMQVAKEAARWCCYAAASLNFGYLGGRSLPAWRPQAIGP
jgi:hypothetical protein